MGEGYLSGVYTREENGREYTVIAYAGTDEHHKDWFTNIPQMLGYTPQQYKDALVIASYYKDKDNVTLVGHSLGGGLASLAALVYDINAITFNAAGLSKGVMEDHGILNKYQGRITANIIHGEILNALFWNTQYQAAGQFIFYWQPKKSDDGRISRHSINQFINR